MEIEQEYFHTYMINYLQKLFQKNGILQGADLEYLTKYCIKLKKEPDCERTISRIYS